MDKINNQTKDEAIISVIQHVSLDSVSKYLASNKSFTQAVVVTFANDNIQ